ncbi:MAG: hypothetical protein U0270_08960 [Labilithrix sp.]
MKRLLVGVALVVAWGCERRPDQPAPPIASVAPPPASTAMTPVTPPTPAGPPAPSSSAPTFGATGARSARASKAIAACTPPPPTACRQDGDCAIFDLETSDNPCASTLRAGIDASRKASYLASAPCPRRPSAGPPCVVHWVRAEDGPDTPPSGTEIGVRCVKGACLTQYYPSSGAR